MAMDAARVHELFLRMRDREDGVGNFVYGHLMKVLVGRSMDALIPVLEEAHARLGHTGTVALDSGRSVSVISPPEGQHGGVWRKAILLEGAGRMATLTMLEVDGEPDPGLDAILEKAMQERFGNSGPRQARKPGPCDAAKVYQLAEPRTPAKLANIMARDAADKWSPEMLVEAGRACCLGDRNEWMQGSGDSLSSDGLDHWQGYFADVGSMVHRLGLERCMEHSVREMSARRWWSSSMGVDDGSLDDYAAAEEFASQVIQEDGYLPAAYTVAALDALDRIAAEDAMASVASNFEKLVTTFVEHPELVEGGRFEGNDGRNNVVGFEHHADDDSGWHLRMEDQSNTFHVKRQGTHISAQCTRGRVGGPCVRVAFDQGTDGTWCMSGTIGQSKAAIHAWNGLKSMAATLWVCAQEELEYNEQRPRVA
jgi:hypothetical protein